MNNHLLDIRNLKKHFKTKDGLLKAVDGVNFNLDYGKTLGLVGESGCGKSTVGRTIIRLLEPTDGEIIFEDIQVNEINKKQLRQVRRDMQMVFQDPYASLNPRKSVETLIGEPLKWNKTRHSKNKKKYIQELMDIVGLEKRLASSYPHELDGGRRQRIGIARALALEPKLIICDEPVSALDVSVQAQILNLLVNLQKEFDISYLFITHDLSVVNYISDDIAVMYLGQIVEKAPAKELFENPIHPYTKALLSAIPSIDIDRKIERIPLKGEITSPINMKDDCHFAPRCLYAKDCCFKEKPELEDRGNDHFVACHVF